ncbi:olfactory receptor 10G6-like [Sphaerodactylus townsendi]|uniref:olfactory receptor 10G6-like n=1 Tax=Sphaerodactylus townsendi TaxID=933632 RepID=UPI00202742A0|nr:olfactory receptor 10G6-like [Sphaerodactylus townsendi]
MECSNQSAPTEFILAGLRYPKGLEIPVFLFFLIMYILTLSGNSLILWVVVSDLQLHKPMYWFLCHLSVMDMAFSSVVVPRVIAGFVPGGKVISLGECVSQLFFFHFLGCTECFLYTLMAYDRFLAICRPLHYSSLMNWRACLGLSLGTFIGGCLNSMVETILTFQLPFGQRNLVDYIFCDIPAVLKLACADTRLNEMMVVIDVGLVVMTCFLLILTSYVYIVAAILRIKSKEGRRRAFSTCSAHLTVVGIYYIPVLFHYLRPTSQDSMDGVICVLYTAITPFLNPMIYTLRNKDIKLALRRHWGKNSE